MKIVYAEPHCVHPNQMKIGDVAELIKIKERSTSSNLQGRLIVRAQESLQVIGDETYWSNVHNPVNIELVRILKPGDKVEF